MTDDQLELFIELVKRKPELYDPNHQHYKAIHMKAEIWKDLALTCGLKNGGVAKKKWKNLRDCHRDALKRIQSKSGQTSFSSSSASSKTWKFQEAMSFLEEFITKRETHCPPIDNDELTLWLNDNPIQEFPSMECLDAEIETEKNTIRPRSPDKKDRGLIRKLEKCQRRRNKNVLESRRNQIYGYNHTPDPALYSFFMSLYETTLQLSRPTQLEVKRKLFNLVTDYEEKDYTEKSKLPSSSNYQSNFGDIRGFTELIEEDDEDEGSFEENVSLGRSTVSKKDYFTDEKLSDPDMEIKTEIVAD